MAEAGRLVGRYEILDGEIVNKTGQKPTHYISVSLLTQWANRAVGDPFVCVQGPIALPAPDDEYSEPEPDVAITHESTTAYADHHPGPEDLLLVVEVSDTTLRSDLLVKARLYARAGIGRLTSTHVNSTFTARLPTENTLSSPYTPKPKPYFPPCVLPRPSLSPTCCLPPPPNGRQVKDRESCDWNERTSIGYLKSEGTG